MKRSGLQRKTPLRSGNKPLKRVAVNRQGQRGREWSAWVRNNQPAGTCECCGEAEAVLWHHRGQRSTHPAHVLDRVNLACLCWVCHSVVHDKPHQVDAYERGLLLRAWVVPGSDDDPWC